MRLLLVCSLLAAVITALGDEPRTLVDLGYSKYEGFLNENTRNINFLGIRYAAPPTGDRRWREPQSPLPTSGILSANKHPNRCWQYLPSQHVRNTADSPSSSETPDFGVAEGRQHTLVSKSKPSQEAWDTPTGSYGQIPEAPPLSEDCLFLSVSTPANGGGSLPVLVWIHGGAYVAGASYEFNAEDLIAHAGGNAVVVIIQYRLGVFGFLSGQKVHDNGALNAAMLDQQFALRWVHDHISKFGGDPTKVTIWGKSCGGGAVLHHLVANNGNTQPKLFHAAITSSPFLPPVYPYNHWVPEMVFNWVRDAAHCTNAPDALACLRTADAEVLNQLNVDVTLDRVSRTHYFLPVIDGTFMTERPSVLLREGKLNTDALLTMVTRNETGLWKIANPASSLTNLPDFIPTLWPEVTKDQIDILVDLYQDQGNLIEQAYALKSESNFVCPSYYLLQALKGKAFTSLFAVPPAWHFDDYPYYWNTSVSAHEGSKTFDNVEFRNNFAQMFMDFTMSLDPNTKWSSSNTLPHWPQWNNGYAEMVFNKTETNEPSFEVVPTDHNLIRRCQFWENIGASTWQ